MNYHKIELRAPGGDPYASRVYLDGEMLVGVTRAEIVVDVNNPEIAAVTIQMFADVTVSLEEMRERQFISLSRASDENFPEQEISGGTCGDLTWWCGGQGEAGAGYFIHGGLTICASCYRLAPFTNGCRWVSAEELARAEQEQYEDEADASAP